jgi:uncharacterized protein YeaO (DUF488 family)
MKTKINLKRVYDPADDSDGRRILVDRLWPRGVSKERARIDLWLKEAGPSTELRKWFGHDPKRWEEFRRRYRAELETNAALDTLKDIASEHAVVTLVFGATNRTHNQAVVLKEVLQANAD